MSMKCLSLWQPWATLWLLSDPDEKVFETRSWRMSHQGQLLVHAAKKRDREVAAALSGGPLTTRLLIRGYRADDEAGRHLAFGAIIGKVDVIGCAQMSRMFNLGFHLSERERLAGDWTDKSRYAIQRASKPIIFKTPIPYRGSQGIFEVPDEVVKAELEK